MLFMALVRQVLFTTLSYMDACSELLSDLNVFAAFKQGNLLTAFRFDVVCQGIAGIKLPVCIPAISASDKITYNILGGDEIFIFFSKFNQVL